MRYTIWVIILLFSCQDKAAIREALKEQEVDKKLTTYRQERMRICRDKLMDDVIEDADSIMLKNAYFDLPDTLKIPEKRMRPGQPTTPLPDFEKPVPPLDTVSPSDTLSDTLQLK